MGTRMTQIKRIDEDKKTEFIRHIRVNRVPI
jgi:hypothetical protein